MNKAQLIFWIFWAWIGLTSIVLFINLVVGLIMFVSPLIGILVGIMIWAFRDLYRILGDG